MQFDIGGTGDIFLLNRSVDKSRLISFSRWVVIIDTNTFGKNQLNTLFADTMPEMNRFGGITGIRRHKFVRSTKVLAAGTLTPLFYNGFIR